MKLLAQIRAALPSLCVVALAAHSTMALAAHTYSGDLMGLTYRPADANYTLSGLQGVASLDAGVAPRWDLSAQPQIVKNAEFTGSIGVAYQAKHGSAPVNFGIGLFAPDTRSTWTTGLKVTYDQAMDASSIHVVLADFDLKSSAKDFNAKKVAASILLLDERGQLLADAGPKSVFSSMKSHTGPCSEDCWDLSFQDLLDTLKLPQHTTIGGYILYADHSRGEVANSDPYFLLSSRGAVAAVPELNQAGMWLMGLGAMAGLAGRRRAQRSGSQA